MNAFPSKSLSDNRKPVVSNVEPSAIQNPKWVAIFAIVLTFVFDGVVAAAQQPKKVPRLGYLLPVVQLVTPPAPREFG
jgi:hypothetical protein